MGLDYNVLAHTRRVPPYVQYWKCPISGLWMIWLYIATLAVLRYDLNGLVLVPSVSSAFPIGREVPCGGWESPPDSLTKFTKQLSERCVEAMTAKVMVLYSTPTDPDTFDAYYVADHLPLVRAVPGLRSAATSVGPIGGPEGPAPYYQVSTYTWDTMRSYSTRSARRRGWPQPGISLELCDRRRDSAHLRGASSLNVASNRLDRSLAPSHRTATGGRFGGGLHTLRRF